MSAHLSTQEVYPYIAQGKEQTWRTRTAPLCPIARANKVGITLAALEPLARSHVLHDILDGAKAISAV